MLITVGLVIAPVCVLAQTDIGRFNIVEATIPEMQAAMAGGKVTALDLVEAYLARINEYDQQGPRLNAILHIHCLLYTSDAADEN